jgi:hypothetical protein
MKARDLPFVCDECNDTFASKGARNQHKKAKHRIKVHTFGDLAQELNMRSQPQESPRKPEGGSGRHVIPAIASLALAPLYWLLLDGSLEVHVLPWWFLPVATVSFTIGTWLIVFGLLSAISDGKTVTDKQQKGPKR